MEIRQLTLDDAPQFQSVIFSRSTNLGVSPDSLPLHLDFSYLNTLDLVRCGPTVGTVFGRFDEKGELEGFLSTVISTAQPCFFIRKAHTRPGANLDCLSSLFETAMKHYAVRGFLRSYTAYRERDVAVYWRLWRTSTVLKDYVSYTDMVIEPNTRPKHSDVWQHLLGRALSPERIVVRGFIKSSFDLKAPEHLPNTGS